MLPHLAIGGITPENIELLVAVGVRGVAVSSCVCGSTAPEETCRRLRAALRS
jgi:thiamine monophosphate synthase